MTREVLSFILRQIFNSTYTPVIVYENGEIKEEFHADDWFYLKTYCEKAMDTENDYNLYVSSQSLAFGFIRYEDKKILFGPIRVVPLNHAMIMEIILDNNLHLEVAKDLMHALNFTPSMQIDHFANWLSGYYVNLKQTILTSEDFLSKVKFEITESDVDIKLLKKQNEIIFGNNLQHNTFDYEQKMLYCVRNGLVEDLHKMGNLTPEQHIDIGGADTLRKYKNLLMTQNTLISRAAIDGGADPETVFSLSDIFTHKVENCTTLKQIHEASYQINDTFCKMVRDIKYPKTNDLIVTQAINYINNHITDKISTAEIAENLGITREYLSTKFTKVMGQPISEFVNEQKIAVAKKLLKFSDKPLIAISNYLSFSSQSYFQMQFKKVTGLTPLEYRSKKITK